MQINLNNIKEKQKKMGKTEFQLLPLNKENGKNRVSITTFK